MTLREVSDQIHSLSHGVINGMHNLTKERTYSLLCNGMQNAEHNKIPDTFVIQISLPDGDWLTTIYKCPAGYDYCIPDTREEEQRIWDRLTK